MEFECNPATIELSDPRTVVSSEPETEQEEQQAALWCYCQTGESGEMICYDSTSCNIYSGSRQFVFALLKY